MGAAIKHPAPDCVKPSFVIFDIWALWRSVLSVRVPRCQKFQKTVWHRMLYGCTPYTASVVIKGLNNIKHSWDFVLVLWVDGASGGNDSAIWRLNWQMCGAGVERPRSEWWVIVVNVVCSVDVDTSTDVISERPWCQVVHYLHRRSRRTWTVDL